ncbi:MAG: ATP-dependent 6-phosphofructokinase [Acidimicrobiia bacterium]|nr:MAG: ATP-dependent 6-phosphofructokinase [Acidimicrobiia bacterium]
MGAIGVLTGGGDCPGLNAVIRGVVSRAVDINAEVVGIRDGWEGLMHDRTMPLDRESVRGILAIGGTILGTSRMDPYVHGEGLASCSPTLTRNGIDKLIVIGGDGTLRSAMRLADEGLHVIGVPKTIDNDIPGTDTTFGFATAVQVATDAIDRLTTTAEAHNRVMIVEVMGRTQGWIATYAGIAGGADSILVPEFDYDIAEVVDKLRSRHRAGHRYSIVVVAEGIEPPEGYRTTENKKDAFGFDRLGGVGYQVAAAIEDQTSFETRVTILGHIQRGGSPVAADRVLASRLGVKATDLAVSGVSNVMVAVRGTEIVSCPMEEATDSIRAVPQDLYDTAATFFG